MTMAVPVGQEQSALVSVIIPATNAEPFIRRCLESLLPAARVLPVEVFLVANGCTDRTVSIGREFMPWLALRVIEIPEAIGPSAARNAGLQAASGDWIYFLDADDLVPPGAIEAHESLMRQTASDLLVGAYIKADRNGVGTVSRHQLERAQELDSLALANYVCRYANEPYKHTLPVHCWGKLYRGRVLRMQRLRFDESLHQLEDVNFNFRLLASIHSVYYSNRVLYQYHMNSHARNLSSMSGDAPDALQAMEKAYAPVRCFIAASPLPEAERKADARYAHLYASSALLWLIRAGKKFGGKDWRSCCTAVDWIVRNESFQKCMKYYRSMPSTSRVLPWLSRMKLSLLITFYFKLRFNKK
jgi:glycosyltransferase involved in cell wall biosynthesis